MDFGEDVGDLFGNGSTRMKSGESSMDRVGGGDTAGGVDLLDGEAVSGVDRLD